MNVYIDCIGCEQRQLDAQRVIAYLKANRINLVDDPAKSDYTILVTCAVDKTSEDASVAKMESILSRLKPTGRLVIGGCLPSISPERVNRYGVYATFSGLIEGRQPPITNLPVGFSLDNMLSIFATEASSLVLSTAQVTKIV